jgi:hypothetical protein
MQVEHPLAGDGDGVAPSAVDIDGNTVALDEDGTVELPDGRESWLQRFADTYDTTPDDLLADVDTISHDKLVATVEAGTVEDIADRIDAGDFDGVLEDLRAVEADRDDRSGVHEAIDDRQDSLEA